MRRDSSSITPDANLDRCGPLGGRSSHEGAAWLADGWADDQPGDVRLVTIAIRCVGELTYQKGLALGWEVIGLDAAETVPVLVPLK